MARSSTIADYGILEHLGHDIYLCVSCTVVVMLAFRFSLCVWGCFFFSFFSRYVFVCLCLCHV